MHKLPRKKALDLIRLAGIESNHRSFMRLYVENCVSYPVAIAEYRKGVAIARSHQERERQIAEIAHQHRLHPDDDADVIAEIYAERAIINAA